MLARCRIVTALLACLWLCLGAPSAAWANMAQAVFYGDRFGTLVAQKATDVRVDRETLSFDLTEALATAQVTAVYQMTNAGAQSDLEVAFVFVRGEEEPSLTMSITAELLGYVFFKRGS